MRESFLLVCTECKSENYVTNKNKQTTTTKLELMKYCPKCRKETKHKEKSKK